MTYLLDTNVLTELMRPAPALAVIEWVNRQASSRLYTGAICEAEIMAGIAVLPPGRKKSSLLEAAAIMFAEDFHGRVLPFDSAAARAFAELVAKRRAGGRPVDTIDLLIGAVAARHGASVVTRNVGDFTDCGLQVIDPWSADSAAH